MYTFICYFLVLLLAFVMPIASQENSATTFQLIPGQRSLPDFIPQDEYIYIPEGLTNDAVPSTNLNSEPPAGGVNIPPLNQKVKPQKPDDVKEPPQKSDIDSNPNLDVDLNPSSNVSSNPSNVVSEPHSVFLVEKTEPQYPILNSPNGDVAARLPSDVFDLDSPDNIADSPPRGIEYASPHAYSPPRGIEYVSPPADSPSQGIEYASPPADSHSQGIEYKSPATQTQSTGKVHPVAVLQRGIYIQIVSYDKLSSISSLLDNTNVAQAIPRGILNIYKTTQSNYYKVLIGPFSSSEVGLELFRWRRYGFDDAYVVDKQ